MKKEVLVSVDMVTYMHEAYIKQAIEGVLTQETSFEYDLIIADDCSLDRTSEIVNEIIKNHDKGYRIKYFRHKKNLGIHVNCLFALQQCKSKYIAVCDGDDYWIDTLKLQKQVDFLEKNEDYNLVGHYTKSTNDKILGKFTEDIFEFKDIYQKNIRIPTASLFFRNNIEYPNWINDIYGVDRAVIFLNAQKGKLKVLPFFGSFYRVHEGGAEHISKKDKFKLAVRNIKEEFIYYTILKSEHEVSIIKKRIFKNHFYILALSIKKIEPIKFLKGFHSLVCFNFYDKIKY